jgi:hypothetical protein
VRFGDGDERYITLPLNLQLLILDHHHQTSSIECYLHSQGPNKTSTLSTTQIVYSSTTMPHHLNNHTHTHDVIPQPCTTISLSPCVNYVDGSPLGPVSFMPLPSSPFERQMDVRGLMRMRLMLAEKQVMFATRQCSCGRYVIAGKRCPCGVQN